MSSGIAKLGSSFESTDYRRRSGALRPETSRPPTRTAAPTAPRTGKGRTSSLGKTHYLARVDVEAEDCRLRIRGPCADLEVRIRRGLQPDLIDVAGVLPVGEIQDHESCGRELAEGAVVVEQISIAVVAAEDRLRACDLADPAIRDLLIQLLSHVLHGREQLRDENALDGDHDQEFDQGVARCASTFCRHTRVYHFGANSIQRGRSKIRKLC